MAQDSKIQWTTHTYNPWWGCTKISPGCAKCYADTFAKRVGQKVWGDDAPRRFFGDKHWAEPMKWNREAEKAGKAVEVFCGSMCDINEGRDDLKPHRDRLYTLVEETPWLNWQLLTKRPENVLDHIPAHWHDRPPKNWWQGTSVEDQKRADERIPHLLRCPAAVRFLSVEPLLGPIDLNDVTNGVMQYMPLKARAVDCSQDDPAKALINHGKIHWVIVGGESGHGARPCYTNWIDSIADQCKAAGVALFVKQMGSNHRCVDDEFGDVAIKLKDTKGGDIEEFPADLRVREFPKAVSHA